MKKKGKIETKKDKYSIKDRQFLNQLSDYQIIKTGLETG
jgi:hypothetical protein